jgi:hypothetical protein
VFEDGGEVAGEAGVLERVGVTAFWQQTHPSDRGEHEPVHEAVGELDPGGVVAKLAGVLSVGIADLPYQSFPAREAGGEPGGERWVDLGEQFGDVVK